jgi:tetratricopeptide (TPR) repeat protein
VLYAALFGLLAQVCPAENVPKAVLDTNETLFTVLTAINACGYDQELGASDPLRTQIRAEVARAIQASDDTREVTRNLCQYYKEHQAQDASRNLTPYVSLALYLGPPPEFAPKAKEAEVAPDARVVFGIVPILQAFYAKAGLHAIWERHRNAYAALPDRYHDAVAKMFFNTEIYLKLASAGYLGSQFTVYLDPMGAPSQINARNYGSDYYVVISPSGTSLKMDQIRHTYLHYLLDPMALKYPSQIKRLEPLLDAVKTAPMEESFKNDASLLVTECLIRAIEARTGGSGKTPEEERQKAVQDSVEQGFILVRYFYDALIPFEKDPAGLRSAYEDILQGIDVRKEFRRAGEVQFASNALPELLRLARPSEGHVLQDAEKRLSAGDPEAAQKLAQQALDEGSEDSGRALFILAQVATMNRDMEGARNYFLRALDVAREPKVVAWSHIYLGRIFDLQEDRDAALDHYRAALNVGGTLPEVKAAAERGMQQPYEPPARPQ